MYQLFSFIFIDAYIIHHMLTKVKCKINLTGKFIKGVKKYYDLLLQRPFSADVSAR